MAAAGGSDGDDEPLLSELCRICNTNVPRYRCPRCGLRTCSLPCSRRHKLWAQCDGVRDPGVYVKRAELSTPAGIDRDFNFLVGIERRLERGDRDVEERGIEVADERDEQRPWSGRRNLQKGESNVAAALERCGVVVRRAPKGMQRAKDNNTHWKKKQKCLTWTVEWIDESRKPKLGTLFETSTLAAAYQGFEDEQRRLAKKRELHLPEGESEAPRYFYLLRPHTRSAAHVLIPLSPSVPFSECLRDRVLLEFPTVYALPYPPTELPPGFVSESEYLGQGRMKDDEDDEEDEVPSHSIGVEEPPREEDGPGAVDEWKIQGMSARDLQSSGPAGVE
ncbi:MAG: hypothetical protein M1832_003607 [Thelocarpon impressellum]|nr:MAG: hypothetical protein M1832_003607 [Thelocarpon impressellum]